MKIYQAQLATPFAVLGIVTAQDKLTGIDFLPPDSPPLEAQSPLAREVCAQLLAYLANANFRFDLPLQPRGTPYQHKVWQALLQIPAGRTATYGALAMQIGSAPRALGQACGANPMPIVIPCHRVVSRKGLGGFMRYGRGAPLELKRWLLEHERGQP